MSTQPKIVLQDKPSAIPIFAECIGVTFVFITLAAIVIPLVRSASFFAYLYFGFTFLIIAAETIRSMPDLITREFAGATITQTHFLARQGLLDRDGYTIPLQRIQDKVPISLWQDKPSTTATSSSQHQRAISKSATWRIPNDGNKRFSKGSRSDFHMKHILVQTCLDCHFLCIAGSLSPSIERPHRPLSLQQRNTLRDGIPRRHVALDNVRDIACHLGEWTETDPIDKTDRISELTKDRRGLCFFWTYKPSQTLQAAEIQQQRAEERNKLLFSRYLAIAGIFIAAVGLFFNLLDSLPKIAEFARSIMGSNTSPPPYP